MSTDYRQMSFDVRSRRFFNDSALLSQPKRCREKKKKSIMSTRDLTFLRTDLNNGTIFFYIDYYRFIRFGLIGIMNTRLTFRALLLVFELGINTFT